MIKFIYRYLKYKRFKIEHTSGRIYKGFYHPKKDMFYIKVYNIIYIYTEDIFCQIYSNKSFKFLSVG